MRIGLFTDTYHPNTNGVVVVVDIIRRNLEALGHEVYVFAPHPGIKSPPKDDDHVIRFMAIENLFFAEQMTSVFFPRKQLRRVEKLSLDACMVFSPGQVGLFGAYVAIHSGLPLIEQYSTDLTEYVKRYPRVIYGVFALGMIAPFMLKLSPREILEIAKAMKPPPDGVLHWGASLTAKTLRVFHDQFDTIVAVSPKIGNDLRKETERPIAVIPTGVDPLPYEAGQAEAFRQAHGIEPEAEVILYVGRLAKEKNLDVLIEAFEHIAKARPRAVLVFVGGFAYKDVLEEAAHNHTYGDRIIFTGKIPRQSLAAAYETAQVFVFPSLTDTQALVLNEAALHGAPIVWCDPDVNDAAQDGVNGILAKPSPKEIARAVIEIISNPKKQQKYSAASRNLALKFSEATQTKELAKLLTKLQKKSRRINQN
jgi:glycosyltransferase involved in cell wall biosynthesis